MFHFDESIRYDEDKPAVGNALSFRLIGEYNDFDQVFFIQPLLKWNPNPFTIFYIGGTNGYSRVEPTTNFGREDSQLYFKFQYLFDL